MFRKSCNKKWNIYVTTCSIHYLVSFAVLEIIKLICSILCQAPELVDKFDQITY